MHYDNYQSLKVQSHISLAIVPGYLCDGVWGNIKVSKDPGSNGTNLRRTTSYFAYSGMSLAGEVVHGRTDNGSKDGIQPVKP